MIAATVQLLVYGHGGDGLASEIAHVIARALVYAGITHLLRNTPAAAGVAAIVAGVVVLALLRRRRRRRT